MGGVWHSLTDFTFRYIASFFFRGSGVDMGFPRFFSTERYPILLPTLGGLSYCTEQGSWFR